MRTIERYQDFGTNSKEAYELLAMRYSWYKDAAENFGQEGALLYAGNVTPEGYSVWFIGHSNLTGTESRKWKNIVSLDWNTIDMIWKVAPPDEDYDLAYRVVFVKENDGHYRFLGVCKKTPAHFTKLSNGKAAWVENYTCVSDCYPIVKR